MTILKHITKSSGSERGIVYFNMVEYMNKDRFVRKTYDSVGDVLYLLLENAYLTAKQEKEEGFIVHYGKNDVPVGATLLDYTSYWADRRTELEEYTLKYLNLSLDDLKI